MNNFNFNENILNEIKKKIQVYNKLKKIEDDLLKPKFENKISEKIYEKINEKYSKIKEIEKYNLKNYKRILNEKKSLLLGNENDREFHRIKLIECFMEKIRSLKMKNIKKNDVPLFQTIPKPFKLNFSNSSDYLISFNNNHCTSLNNDFKSRNKKKNKRKFINLKINNFSKKFNVYKSYKNFSNYMKYNKNVLNGKLKNIIDNIDKSSCDLQKEIFSFKKIKKNFSNDDIKKKNLTIETNKSNNSNYNFPLLKYKNPKITKYIQENKMKIEEFSNKKKFFKKFNHKINI